MSLRTFDREIAEIQSRLESLPVREPGETVGTEGLYIPRDSESPTVITVDLQGLFPIERIALVPTLLQDVEGDREVVGFPRRFDIMGDEDAAFESAVFFYQGAGVDYPRPSGYPVLFEGGGKRVRFIRIVVHDRPTVRGRIAVSFAELFVFSGGRNVAARKPLEAPEARSWDNLFDTSFFVDGQTSFGQPILESKASNRARGWHAKVEPKAQSEAFVGLRFQEPHHVEEVRLYPVYHDLWPRSTDYGFPIHFKLQVHDPATGWSTVEDWSRRPFPPPGNSPVYFPLGERVVDAVRLQAIELPQSIPGRYIFALAEIEVFSAGRNIAPQGEVVSSAQHTYREEEWNEGALTDGYATRGSILPLQDWLEGLAERGRLEAELERLLAQRSERQGKLTLVLRSAVAVLAVSLLVVGLLLVRNRMVRRKQLQALQNQIASDLHDEVGSNLASMTMLAAGAKDECEAGSAQAACFQRLVEISKETSSSMHDIVWMLHPDRKANMSLNAKLRDIASSLLADREFAFFGTEDVSTKKVSIDNLHHFLLFYKEALHNLARHSSATRIEISIGGVDERIRLEIVDDGVSTDSGELPEGLRLRAKKMNGVLNYQAQREQNRLTLTLS